MEPSQEDFMNAFERTNDKGDLKLSKEEAEKFKTAFEDPEFCKLMSDYVADLQNPEYRAETEAYIGQLESEDKVPSGKELIRPEKGFVAKSRKKDTKDKEDSKVFINIVQSEKITKPTKTDTAKGQNWSLPYSLGPPHMEKDKKEDAVVAFDCCFHPEALQMGNRYKAFRDLLVSTAIQGIEEACRLQNQVTTVSKEFHVLKGVTYKTGEVPTMMIDLDSKENKWNTDEIKKQQENTEKTKPKPEDKKIVKEETKEQSAMDMVTALENNESTNHPEKPPKTTKTKSKPAVKKGFLNNPKTAGSLYPSGSDEGKRGVIPTKPLVEELPEGYVSKAVPNSQPTAEVKKSDKDSSGEAPGTPLMTARAVTRKTKTKTSATSTASTSCPETNEKTPHYTLIERGILGLGDFDGGNSSHKKKPVSSRPEELVYRIEIPLVTKTSKVELDVGEKELKMTYLDTYDLCIQLPYRVYEKKGGAKFDKVKKLLTITLPVQPFQLAHDDAQDEVAADSNDVEVISESNNEDNAESSTQANLSTKRTNAHGRWLSTEEDTNKVQSQDQKETHDTEDVVPPRVEEVTDETDASAGSSTPETLSEEIARKSKEAVTAAKLKAEAEKKNPSKKSKASSSKVTKTESSVSSEFLPSGTYVGSKKGYAFKKGDSGMGYYLDNGGKPIPKTSTVPKPVDSLDAIDINSSTIDCGTSGDKENSGENTPAAIDWQAFPFQFRQTKEGIAMIIDVKDIIEESVNINFQSKAIDVSFAAAAAADSNRVEIKTVDFALSFDCLKEIDIKTCTFDVATHNMVVVLQKKVPEFWVSEEANNGIGKQSTDVLVSRAYSGSVVNSSSSKSRSDPSIIEKESTSTPKESSKINSNTSASKETHAEIGADTVLVDATSLLQTMKFASAGLLELD